MAVAVIGWGSLIWCPGNLRIKARWRPDGPTLPIEFARISRDRRLTLVILPGAREQPTYWALSEFQNRDDARQNLKERERSKLSHIHWLTAQHHHPEVPLLVVQRVRDWLALQKGVDAAIWTGLTTNWKEKRGRDFTPADAEHYLKELESERDRAATAYERAREYLENTPSLIQTNVRRAMQKKGWSDAELATILFERIISRTRSKSRG